MKFRSIVVVRFTGGAGCALCILFKLVDAAPFSSLDIESEIVCLADSLADRYHSIIIVTSPSPTHCYCYIIAHAHNFTHKKTVQDIVDFQDLAFLNSSTVSAHAQYSTI